MECRWVFFRFSHSIVGNLPPSSFDSLKDTLEHVLIFVTLEMIGKGTKEEEEVATVKMLYWRFNNKQPFTIIVRNQMMEIEGIGEGGR